MIALTGKITDKQGQPIWNAHVLFLDQNGNDHSPPIGTITNLDGNYIFENLAGYSIKITHISYQSKIVTFSPPSSFPLVINTSLNESSNTLPQVEIVALKDTWYRKNKNYVFAAAAILAAGILMSIKSK